MRGWGCTKDPNLCWPLVSFLDILPPYWEEDWSAFPDKGKREWCCCQLWLCGSIAEKLWVFIISEDDWPPKLVACWWNTPVSGTVSAEFEGNVERMALGKPCCAKYGQICELLEELEWSRNMALLMTSWSFSENWDRVRGNSNTKISLKLIMNLKRLTCTGHWFCFPAGGINF